MILAAFETLLDRTPPAWLRKVEAAALLSLFAEAFEVDAPGLEDRTPQEALFAYREFTAACMESAQEDAAVAQRYRARLGEAALLLGSKVRKALAVRPSQAFRYARFFYRGIGIELEGSLPGDLRFGPCMFSERYTPGDCAFMSAFDEGFMRGLTGQEDAHLEFSCRLTEGASCCDACFRRG